MIKAIIFDLDDTLFEEKDFVMSGFNAVARQLNELFPTKSADDYFKIMKCLFDNGQRIDIFDRLLEICEINKLQIIPELVRLYRQHLPNIKLCYDANEVLPKLKKMNYKIGLITDGYRMVQRNKVQALDIEQYFDAIIYSDDLGLEHWKPSELPYKLCLENLNVTSTETVFVGDNPIKDFITANKLGITTVRILRPNGEYREKSCGKQYDAKYHIRNLYELCPIFKKNS